MGTAAGGWYEGIASRFLGIAIGGTEKLCGVIGRVGGAAAAGGGGDTGGIMGSGMACGGMACGIPCWGIGGCGYAG